MPEFGNTFTSECTAPSTPFHYVSTNGIRGTTDILFSSLSALLLFTWAIQHLSVPAQRESASLKLNIANAVRAIVIRVYYMVVTLVAPEILIGKALVDWISARTSMEEMREFAQIDGVEWGSTHAFFANMGGFVVRFTERTGRGDVK
jgi:hypothetical protein